MDRSQSTPCHVFNMEVIRQIYTNDVQMFVYFPTNEQVYHDYGLKHVMLILLLVLYQFLGAAVFYYTEAGFDEDKVRCRTIVSKLFLTFFKLFCRGILCKISQ